MRFKFVVTVDQAKDFNETPDDWRDYLANLLKDHISHYNPEVRIARPLSNPTDNLLQRIAASMCGLYADKLSPSEWLIFNILRNNELIFVAANNRLVLLSQEKKK